MYYRSKRYISPRLIEIYPEDEIDFVVGKMLKPINYSLKSKSIVDLDIPFLGNIHTSRNKKWVTKEDLKKNRKPKKRGRPIRKRPPIQPLVLYELIYKESLTSLEEILDKGVLQ